MRKISIYPKRVSIYYNNYFKLVITIVIALLKHVGLPLDDLTVALVQLGIEIIYTLLKKGIDMNSILCDFPGLSIATLGGILR